MDQNEALSGSANAQGDQSNNHQTMESLLESETLSVELPQTGEIRTGTIASIGPSQILVSVGAKSEGVISGRELEQLTEEERAELQVGQEVNVFVINPEDQNGNVVLSFKRAQEQMSWDNVERMIADETVVDTKIIGFNKGGLIAAIGNLRGFIPSSQISAVRRAQAVGDTPEQRWQKMVGQPISVRIIEVDRERRRLILSERAASTESRAAMKDRVIGELEDGMTYTGRVTSLADFGAFVNINGADGLVHLSELSWDHITHPKEILEVGQEVQVKVINIDHEKKRIGLSLRALQDDPWKDRMLKYSVGQLVEGVITRLTKFGAFARLEGDIEGLIHISELSENRVEHPKEVLKEGEVKTLRVIRIDTDQHRIGLSLRKVDSAAFADKDFKLLTQQLAQQDTEEESQPVEAPQVEESQPAEAPEPETSEPLEAPQPAEAPEPEVSEPVEAPQPEETQQDETPPAEEGKE